MSRVEQEHREEMAQARALRPPSGPMPAGELAVVAEFKDGTFGYQPIPSKHFVVATRMAADRAAAILAADPDVKVARVVMILAAYPPA